jgi:hypothetical protein
VSKYEIGMSARTSAPPTIVYALLRDGSTWPDWTSIDSFELERPGEGEPEGVGAVRVFRSGRVVGHDAVRGFVANRRFSYEHLQGLPVRDYHGTVTLEPDGDGTAIHWHVSYRPKYRGSGWLMQPALRRFIRRTVQGLATHAAALSFGSR